MNKTALGTILGAVLLGLAKSKGSSAKTSAFDEIFKRRVGNQKQIFKIDFWMNYAPFWISNGWSSAVTYDFEQYVQDFLDIISNVSNGFQDYLENECHIYGAAEDHYYIIDDVEAARQQAVRQQGNAEEWLTYIQDWDKDDLFEKWCYDNDMYWSDDLASDIMVLDEWKYLEDLRSNSEFDLKFTESMDADDIQQDIINQRAGELEHLIDDDNIFDYGMHDYLVGPFLETLYERGSFEGIEWEDEGEFNALQDQIIEKKEELKEFLNEEKNDIFGTEGEWLFDWDDEIQLESGYVTGVLNVKLNLETMGLSKTQWTGFIETVLHNAYFEWYRQEKPSDTIGDSEVGDPQILKIEPDIWAKKKSNLRKR